MSRSPWTTRSAGRYPDDTPQKGSSAMTAVQGTTVDVPTEDGTADAYLTRPADGAAHPAVLLYMDALGLRPQLRSLADRLAGEGYTVLMPNVFYRHGRAPLFDLPEFIDPGVRPEIFERIGPVMRSLTNERAMRDAGAYLRWLAESPAVARSGSRPRPASTAGGWRRTRRTARTWWPAVSPPSCTSATPTRTTRCRRSRSSAWKRL